MVERYLQKECARPTWDIKNMSEKERKALKSNLEIALLDNEDDYRAVIGYMYGKYPYEMDGVKAPDTGKRDVPIQWRYSEAKNKQMLYNFITEKYQDMYAFVVYDRERDKEPVIVAGSYFKLSKVIDELNDSMNVNFLMDENGALNQNGQYQAVGHGYVMFCDPNYRRLGLATDLWWAEAQLYREALGIRFQREIQNEYSLISTQKMFSDPSKCIITSPGRLKNDGTRAQIRVLLDYMDQDLVDGFNSMQDSLKCIYAKPSWHFIEREELNKESLLSYWK